MTERRPHFGPRGRAGVLSWAVLAVVCVVVIALLAIVQVPHLHVTQADADHCPLCIVMHSSVPVSLAAAVVILVQVGTSVSPAEPVRVLRMRHTRLSIRPPPLGC